MKPKVRGGKGSVDAYGNFTQHTSASNALGKKIKTAGDRKVCKECQENKRTGGATPVHPNCRCHR